MNKSQKSLAPIVLFVFARPDHTKRTLEALAANDLAEDSDLIIYSDAARNQLQFDAVNEVRLLAKATTGFRSVTLIERQSNYGLAKNIIEGVTEACARYERVIVLEDDHVTSSRFLTFMNLALDRYQADERVWHVSGWNYPIDPGALGDAFFLRVMNCWGWGTWKDRWQHFEKNTEKLISEFDEKMIRDFDLNGSGVFWSQVILNLENKIDTWAIYWYATIFKNGGLCLNPSVSYLDNIGHDGSGTHGSRAGRTYSTSLSTNPAPNLPVDIAESELGIERIFEYYQSIRPKLARRIASKAHAFFKRMGAL
ncbi:sugar transferase [Cupriavidus basilensis]|uniref:Sugar transferase n=1 Tax=Cupriavidus basilensis TaxID=68895 RepID=A0A643FQQ6_9BURK|nr:sugar transferase [Cupriavidus basilensis]QOT80681.1 sugar transferase [Cupriavidus basilensis]